MDLDDLVASTSDTIFDTINMYDTDTPPPRELQPAARILHRLHNALLSCNTVYDGHREMDADRDDLLGLKLHRCHFLATRIRTVIDSSRIPGPNISDQDKLEALTKTNYLLQKMYVCVNSLPRKRSSQHQRQTRSDQALHSLQKTRSCVPSGKYVSTGGSGQYNTINEGSGRLTITNNHRNRTPYDFS